MSLWDILIIVLVCMAIFRGYFKGLCRRFSDWVGLGLSFLIATLSVSRLNDLVTRLFNIDGEALVSDWLENFFSAHVVANPDNQLESLMQWVADLALPNIMRENLYSAIDESANDIYYSIYSQVARVMAEPLWSLVLIIFGSMLCFALLIAIGELFGLVVPRFRVTAVIDRFLGAIISGFMMMLVVAVFTAICVFIVPESADWLGRALHNSFMGPVLNQAVDVILRGGLGG